MPKTTNNLELRNNDAITLPLTSSLSYFELKFSHFWLDVAGSPGVLQNQTKNIWVELVREE